MKKTNLFPIIVLLLTSLLLSACNLPRMLAAELSVEAADADQDATSAVVDSNPLPTDPPQPEEAQPAVEATPEETAEAVEPQTTPAPPTAVPPQPACTDRAAFVADITITDGEEIEAGSAFTKIWRLKNIGTCTWTAAYALVFSHGDQMGAVPVTPLSGLVSPGASVDLAVDLTAPEAAGSYKGFWKLRNNSGVLFGLGAGGDQPFWVQISSAAAEPDGPVFPDLIPLPFPLPLPGFHSTTLDLLKGESGSVYSYGLVKSVENVGDLANNRTAQVFLSFDISAIPAGATISQVKVDFSDYDTLGDPFAGLGCLRAYLDTYGVLDASDYTEGMMLLAVDSWCSTADLDSIDASDLMKTSLQGKLGESRYQLRLQFGTSSDLDGIADMVRLGDLKLIVSYFE